MAAEHHRDEPGVAPDPAPTDFKEPHHYADEPAGDLALPSGWMYRQRRVGTVSIPWYASPKIQLGMVAFVCFLCPGMFNALGGLGGGGRSDATLADNMVSLPARVARSGPC